MKRIVFVSLPLWPVERPASRMHGPRSGKSHTDRRPHSVAGDDAPLALIEAAGAHGLAVYACNRAALTAGVREGEALADVRARLPALVTRPADPAGDAAALNRLASWCERYGPAVNTAGPRGIWIDVSGVAHLFGGETHLLVDLQRRLATFGLTARLGLASTLSAARAIACFSPHVRLRDRIAPGGDAASILADLPVVALGLDAAPLLVLHRLGLKRIGQLYDLPRAALKRRFPSREVAFAVLLCLDHVLGRVPEPLVPRRQPPSHAVRRAFGDPLISREGLAAALTDTLDELCARFAAHHIGARRLTLTLYRSDGTQVEQGLGFSAPTNRPAHMLRLLTERLDRLDEQGGVGNGAEPLLGLGIDALMLAAERTQALPPVQTRMLAQSAGSAGNPMALLCPSTRGGKPVGGSDSGIAVSTLVDRLANKLGPERVQRLVPHASHIPERAQRRLTALASAPPDLACRSVRSPPDAGRMRAPFPSFTGGSGPPRPILLFSPPDPIAVTAEIPEGPPARFTWRRLTRRIVRAEGPERIAPEWWREIAACIPEAGRDEGSGDARPSRTRDYYRVEDDDGARYWVFRDGLYQDRGESRDEDPVSLPRWYVHGLYA